MYIHFVTSKYPAEYNYFDLFKWPLFKNEEILLAAHAIDLSDNVSRYELVF